MVAKSGGSAGAGGASAARAVELRTPWNAWGDNPSARTTKGLPSSGRVFLRREIGLAEDAPLRLPVPLDQMRLPPSRLLDEVRVRLAEVAEVVDDPETRIAHAGGKSYRDLVRRRSGDAGGAPDAVVVPADADAVAAVLRVCADAQVAVVPFGGGTSVVGGVEPLRGRFAAVVTLDLSRLDQLLHLDPYSELATFQPGVRGPAAEQLLRDCGFTLGHFPQSYEQASLGGYVATRSAGQASTGFGRSDELVVGLRAATPAGELVLGRAIRSAAGPDLRQLVVGSEGAFGVLTELTLRVRRAPAARRYEAWFFRSFAEGADAFRTLRQADAAGDVCRLSDVDETRAGLALSGHDRGVGPAYLRLRGRNCLAVLGWEGDREVIAARRKRTAALLRTAGGLYIGQGAGASWEKGRFSGPHLRDDLLDAGVLVETLETATSWSQLVPVHDAVRDALHRAFAARGETALVMCHVSHVYATGASLYFTVLARQADDPEASLVQWETAKKAATDALMNAGATLTHHHAVGADHLPWLEQEVGELGVATLRAVKACLDPAGILNPGKLVP
ncbi:MAG TPA: FAD-binding oxidoreductase [Frankiaceae bacterium]|nr:FAD-binding oxidoreductase [Frankiaceae bacterium]